MKLVLIRHGATEWSVSGRHTGRTDLPLTSDGGEEAVGAQRGVRCMLAEDFDSAVVFSSPRQRARTTADTIFPNHNVTIDDDLAEFDYGDFEGLTSAEIKAIQPTWDLWTAGCPHGETCADVGMRADRFLRRAEGAGPVVVAVAHGHLLRILAVRAVGLVAEQGAILTLDTATVSVIEDIRGRRVIRRWNVDPRAADSVA